MCAIVLGSLAAWPSANPAAAVLQDVDASKDRTERIEWLMESIRDSGATAAVVVARIAGEEVLARGFGEIEGKAAGPDLRVPAGAATELLLAAAVVHAAEQAKVSLDRPLLELLPERNLKGIEATLHQLLAHTSGLAQVPSARPGAAAADAESADKEPHWLAWLRESPRVADPDTCFAWSNADTMLAELWLVDTTGMDARKYVRKHLLKSLSIAPPDDTEPDPETWAALEVHLGQSIHPATQLPEHLAGVGLELSARELVTLLGAVQRRAIVDDTGTQRILDDVRLASGETTGHGYANSITWLDRAPGRAVGGAFRGTAMRLVHYPSLDLEVALLVHGGARSAASWERALTRVLFDLPQAEAADLPLSAEERDRLTGDYQIGCDRLRIFVEEDRLHLDTAEKQIPLAYRGGGVFTALDGSDVSLEFEFDGDGNALQFLLRSDGRHALARRFG